MYQYSLLGSVYIKEKLEGMRKKDIPPFACFLRSYVVLLDFDGLKLSCTLVTVSLLAQLIAYTNIICFLLNFDARYANLRVY
jgi:hypothetical protein